MNEELRNLVAMDLPGRFPITSTSGYKYIFIMYNLVVWIDLESLRCCGHPAGAFFSERMTSLEIWDMRFVILGDRLNGNGQIIRNN